MKGLAHCHRSKETRAWLESYEFKECSKDQRIEFSICFGTLMKTTFYKQCGLFLNPAKRQMEGLSVQLQDLCSQPRLSVKKVLKILDGANLWNNAMPNSVLLSVAQYFLSNQ